ncbi:hypothetical protein NQZ68_014757 [Dissostichus eleginoides]|nr:hypothetical protein NQZ68_014757 [Dissostichus eleginoides]
MEQQGNWLQCKKIAVRLQQIGGSAPVSRLLDAFALSASRCENKAEISSTGSARSRTALKRS